MTPAQQTRTARESWKEVSAPTASVNVTRTGLFSLTKLAVGIKTLAMTAPEMGYALLALQMLTVTPTKIATAPQGGYRLQVGWTSAVTVSWELTAVQQMQTVALPIQIVIVPMCVPAMQDITVIVTKHHVCCGLLMIRVRATQTVRQLPMQTVGLHLYVPATLASK